MKPVLIAFQIALCSLFVTFSGSLFADFKAYLPSRTTNQLWIVQATEKDNHLALDVAEKIDLGFTPATIVAHPEAVSYTHLTLPTPPYV